MYGTTVSFRNSNAIVVISDRLMDWDLTVEVRDPDRTAICNLLPLLSLKSPDQLAEVLHLRRIGGASAGNTALLRACADGLIQHGQELLRGDFGIITTAEYREAQNRLSRMP